jgi:hypothetical protein
MSRFAIVALAVLALVLVAPAVSASVTTFDVTLDQGLKDTITTAPSKLCHPKKPITCRADEFSAMNAITEQAQTTASAWATLPTVEETTEVAAPEMMAYTQDSRLCYGPRYMCAVVEFFSF